MYKHVSIVTGGGPTESDSEPPVDRLARELRENDSVVRCHYVTPVDRAATSYDGLVELYFDSPAAVPASSVEAVLSSTALASTFDLADSPSMAGDERVELDRTDGDTDGCYKHSAFLVRKDGMSYEAFLDHWTNTHVPLAREIPGVVRYARVLPTDRSAVAFDGIAELYFDDLNALRAGLGHESSRDYDPDHPKAKAPREDVDNFLEIGDRPRFVGREQVLVSTERP